MAQMESTSTSTMETPLKIQAGRTTTSSMSIHRHAAKVCFEDILTRLLVHYQCIFQPSRLSIGVFGRNGVSALLLVETVQENGQGIVIPVVLALTRHIP